MSNTDTGVVLMTQFTARTLEHRLSHDVLWKTIRDNDDDDDDDNDNN